jgi:hypothetical protein
MIESYTKREREIIEICNKEKAELIEKIKKAINDKFEEWGGYGDAFGTHSFDDILDTFKNHNHSNDTPTKADTAGETRLSGNGDRCGKTHNQNQVRDKK